MNNKKFYQSKLVWLGVLQIVGATADAAYKFLEAGDFSAGALVGAAMWVVSGISTIKLRFMTKEPIEV